MEKLDSIQQSLCDLSKALKTLLDPTSFEQINNQLKDIYKRYKVKKEVVRLSRVYFTYNLEPNNLDKYYYICKRAVLNDKA